MEHFEIPSSKITKIDIPEVHEEIELAFNNNQIQNSGISIDCDNGYARFISFTTLEKGTHINNHVVIERISERKGKIRITIKYDEASKLLLINSSKTRVKLENADKNSNEIYIVAPSIDIIDSAQERLTLVEAKDSKNGIFNIINSTIKDVTFKNNDINMNNSKCNHLIQQQGTTTPPDITINKSLVKRKDFAHTNKINETV